MKTQITDITGSEYPKDFKDVFNHYLLKNEIIENYNKRESSRLKGKKRKLMSDV